MFRRRPWVLLSLFLLSILLFLAMVGVVNCWVMFHLCLLQKGQKAGRPRWGHRTLAAVPFAPSSAPREGRKAVCPRGTPSFAR